MVHKDHLVICLRDTLRPKRNDYYVISSLDQKNHLSSIFTNIMNYFLLSPHINFLEYLRYRIVTNDTMCNISQINIIYDVYVTVTPNHKLKVCSSTIWNNKMVANGRVLWYGNKYHNHVLRWYRKSFV